jgi:hypothetical protein
MENIDITTKVGEIRLNPGMIVDPEWFEFDRGYNPHNMRPFIVGAEFGALAIVWAEHEQEALDAAVDGDKMDGYIIDNPDEEDYEDHCSAGNASELIHDDYLWIIEFPETGLNWLKAACAELSEVD